jgi:lipoteichoic acid synthase
MPQEIPLLRFLGLLLLPLTFGSLSLLTGSSTAGVGASFARDPFVNMVATGVKEAAIEDDYYDADSIGEHPAAHASLAETPRTQKRNVVLIHLESTRAQSVTPYNKELETTPFLNELSKSSLLVERAYTIVPRSSKASVSVNCGIDPPLQPGPEFEPDGIPVPCLADLLKEQGYYTVFFASTSNAMDNFGAVAEGFGYKEIYSSESMDTGGYKVTNTFGYEDDIMLEPSEQWLENRDKSKPFMAEYFTGTGHYGYECLGTRHGDENFSEDEQLNRYLNCLRLQDIFLKNLTDQYKKLGLYEETIFVIFGDHGEGFGEHGRLLHGDTIYEEGLRVPLIIHAPGWFDGGRRVEGLSNQTDILPTVLEMLGYEVKNGEYPGFSLLRPLPEDRTLMFSCITNRKCLASIKGYEKYIYHYEDQPDELFDLWEDPLEEHNLADESSLKRVEMDQRRDDLRVWQSRINAQYAAHTTSGETNPK